MTIEVLAMVTSSATQLNAILLAMAMQAKMPP